MSRNFTYATLNKGTRAETRVRRCVICGQPEYRRVGHPFRQGGCPFPQFHTPERVAAREYTGPAA
jgi:hypothetical protein